MGCRNAFAEAGCRGAPSGWLSVTVADLCEQLEGQPRLAVAKSARHLSCAALFCLCGVLTRVACLCRQRSSHVGNAHSMSATLIHAQPF